jgi:hypothetical protein
MNQDFIYLIHYGISLLRAKFVSKRGKPLHVTEHHRDLLSFTFDSVLLCQDFFGNAFWKVLLDFLDFLFRGEGLWSFFRRAA